MAIDYSLELNKSSITIVHKGNIMKFTEGAFRDWAYNVVTSEYNGKVLNGLTDHRRTNFREVESSNS